MALKMTSGAWIAAGRENKNQRDSERPAFFSKSGVKPAKSLRDVHIPLKNRWSKVSALFEPASGNRIGDADLADIAEIAKASMSATGIGLPEAYGPQEHQSWGILSLSPEVLKAFFEADHDTSLEQSLMD